MPKKDRYRKPNKKQILKMRLDRANMCDICRMFFGRNKNGDGKNYVMHVDHNHETNKVRGLLCHKCNVGLGYFKDRISHLEAAVDYLKLHAPPDYWDND